MRKLIRLTTKFRNALDTACENDELRIHPFSIFPRECCDLTCDLLGQYLLENDIITHQINGICRTDPLRHHVWLVTNCGIVVDITGDQFIGKLLSANKVKAIHVGAEGPVHKLFSVNRRREENTIFTDPNRFTDFGGRPNKRQRDLISVNEIVRQYL